MRRCFTPNGLAVYSLICYSPLSCDEDEDPFWDVDDEDEDFGILFALLNPVSWDEEALENHDLIFNEVGDQHWLGESATGDLSHCGALMALCYTHEISVTNMDKQPWQYDPTFVHPEDLAAKKASFMLRIYC